MCGPPYMAFWEDVGHLLVSSLAECGLRRYSTDKTGLPYFFSRQYASFMLVLPKLVSGTIHLARWYIFFACTIPRPNSVLTSTSTVGTYSSKLAYWIDVLKVLLYYWSIFHKDIYFWWTITNFVFITCWGSFIAMLNACKFLNIQIISNW